LVGYRSLLSLSNQSPGALEVMAGGRFLCVDLVDFLGGWEGSDEVQALDQALHCCVAEVVVVEHDPGEVHAQKPDFLKNLVSG
jgi:hypothetical protein